MTKKYFIDDEEVTESEFEERLETETDYAAETNYDDILDESYDEIKIGSCTFTPSQVLLNCDPTAYRCGISDYQNSLYEDSMYDLEDGQEVEINKITFRIDEEDDEEDEEDED